MALRGERDVVVQELTHEHKHQCVLELKKVMDDKFDQIMKLLRRSLVQLLNHTIAYPAFWMTGLSMDDLADPPGVGQKGVCAPVAGQGHISAIACHCSWLLGRLPATARGAMAVSIPGGHNATKGGTGCTPGWVHDAVALTIDGPVRVFRIAVRLLLFSFQI